MPLLRPPLDRFEALWHAEHYDPTLDALTDLTGNGHHARLGSLVGPDTNDMLRLVRDREQYFYHPGTSSNDLSVPDHASLRIIGDIDLRWFGQADWTPASAVALVGRWQSGDQSYLLTLESSWARLYIHDGAASHFVGSAAIPLTDGQDGGIRATRRQSDGQVIFYTSTDGETWTQLSTHTLAAGSAIRAGTAKLTVGSQQSAWWFAGRTYQAEVRDGIDGTVVADVRAADATAPFASFVDRTGKTVTINRSSTGRTLEVVNKTLLLAGPDDYLFVPDHPDLDFAGGAAFTVLLAGRLYGSSTAARGLVAKRNINNNDSVNSVGWSLHLSTNIFVVTDKAQTGFEAFDAAGGLPASGQDFVAAGRMDLGADELEAFRDGVGSGSPGTGLGGNLSNGLGLLIGAAWSTTGSTPQDFYHGAIFGAGLTREALSDV